MSTAAGHRPLRAPGWLAEVARSGTGPVPWAGMGLTALGVGVPLGVGMAARHPVQGVLVAVGGLVASLADRIGPYPARMRRVAAAGVFGGAGGLLVGTAVNGHGWVAAAVLTVVAGASALVSTVGAVWSTTGLYLLVYAILATGPLGAIQPWWQPPLWVLAGVAWVLLLMVPGRLVFPRTVEQRRVAAVYRALAADLRMLGAEGHGTARQGVTAAGTWVQSRQAGERLASVDRGTGSPTLRTTYDGDTLTVSGYRLPEIPTREARELGFTVAAGQTLIVTGASGTGKTTLLTAIAESLQQLTPAVVTAVLADDYLFTGTVAGNIHLANPGATDAEIRQLLTDMALDHLDPQTPVGVGGRGLSGGEQRRLHIARALATHPGVLLIDEPTTGLDAGTATDVLAAVRRRLLHAVLVMAMHRTAGNPDLPRSASFTLSLD